MLVSIIIPIFNAEEYIEECIESVYQQTYPNIEVILINDCTPDNSMEIVEKIINKYKDKFPTTTIDHDYNKGISEARNSGLDIAKGEYIYFIDSDDFIMPNTIELLVNIAIKYKGVELVKGQHIRDVNFITGRYNQKSNINIYKPNDSTKELLEEPFIWNILLNRHFIKKHSITFPSNLIIAEDQFFLYEIAKHPFTLAKLSNITYFYRSNKNSINYNITPQHIESLILNLHLIMSNMSKIKSIKKVQTKRFCIVALDFWNIRFRKATFHKHYYTSYKTTIKRFLKTNYNAIGLYNYLLLSPSFLPYYIAKYYVKLIWKLDSHIRIKPF